MSVWIVVGSDLDYMYAVEAETAEEAAWKDSNGRNVGFVLRLTEDAIKDIKELTKGT